MLKLFFFNFYSLIGNFSFYLLLCILFFSFFLLFSDLRKKFALFVFIIILYSIWGFLLDLDGIFLVFITAEFTIFLLFLMTYLQLYSNYDFLIFKKNYLILFLFLGLLSLLYSPANAYYYFTSFYKNIHHIVSSDFYILYFFLFEKFPVLVVILTLLISFFSLFFIVMYFNLKLVKLFDSKNMKSLHFLRKQVLTKQTNFVSKVYTFQN